MPATDYQGSHIGRSILSLRRDQVAAHSMEGGSAHEATGLEVELEAFQRQVTERFLDLSSAGPDELLSLSWVRRLLDAFLCCQEEFRAILFNNRALVSRPPMDRLIAEFNERTVKALDVCNAIRDGIERIRQWQKLLEIVLCALENQRNLGEGQFRRAKKALIDLAIAMLDEKDSGSTVAHRNRSFGRNNNSSRDHRSVGHFRSLSWSVSRSWSAAKQIQAIGNNLSAPKGNEIVATNGLSVAVFTMASVLLFVMWALVAAIPCQDRGLQAHFSIPRQYTWAAPVLSLHDRIVEESKKRERKNACGLLREIYQVEKCSRMMSEMVDSVQFPLTEEKEGEVRQRIQEVVQVFDSVKEGLDPLERQVREVFHRIVRSRAEGLDYMGRANSHE
ncbi:UPF0496 protein 4-like [Punica granatum]|uniref:UPF0496 protein 4-like n=2 Tax=Punica granatum TaxID=22663 RepID=A0A6P8BYS5_PUNGR|nr:UPF0496 protein 4-like [Punica granatum]XP_031375650.1 UPF0496 protein 4-like [Punica granatum]OWM90754.1 hypothetical protein CDL15_Pgr020717 [Punica granatum]PKI55615.1 hypothetical protein CRG98_024008 [Punica granatum]